ncbi:hypothetical protein TNCV_225771 [Trichonephila clavipes]|nr:hypothetical protein TNCV_225771 [Trichonephila clavipes]
MRGHGSLVVKVSDRVMSSSRVPPKTHRVGERFTLNPLKAQTSSHWCGVIVRRWGSASSDISLKRARAKVGKLIEIESAIGYMRDADQELSPLIAIGLK